MVNRNVNDYLVLPYHIEVVYDNSGEQPGWFAHVLELPGCITQAGTFEELEEMIKDAMRVWVETALEDGQPVPEPHADEDYSGKFVVRLPRSLHRELAEAAERDGVSLNSFVNASLGRTVGQPLARNQEVTSVGVPKPAWPRLSGAARKAMMDAGCDVEAQEIDEQLFASWVERNIEQVKAALEVGQSRDAASYLTQYCAALQSVGETSPLMSVFCRMISLLHEQVEQNAQLRASLVSQAMSRAQILSRAEAQIRATFQLREPRDAVYSAFERDPMTQSLADEMLKKLGLQE